MKKNSIFKKAAGLGLYAFMATFAAVSFSSCDEEMMEYEGPDGVYLMHYEPMGGYEYNTKEVNLMNSAEKEVDFPLSVIITGKVRDYDRPYLIAAVDSSTAVAGEDYILPEGGVIKAGEYTDTLHVKLLKNSKLEKEKVKLIVKVLPNEHFTTDLTKYTTDRKFDPRIFELTFTSIMDKPYWWEYYNASSNVENGNLGFFTAKKISLINELYGLTYADWIEGSPTMNLTKVRFIYIRFGKYLIEQYRNRTPVLEEDGRLMWCYGCPWTSYIGQPWDGTFNPNY